MSVFYKNEVLKMGNIIIQPKTNREGSLRVGWITKTFKRLREKYVTCKYAMGLSKHDGKVVKR